MSVSIYQIGFIVIGLAKFSVSFFPLECRPNTNVATNTTNTSGGLDPIKKRPTLDSDIYPVVCDASIGTTYNATVSKFKEYIYVFPNEKVNEEPPRITVESVSAKLESPLLVVVTQAKSIVSWQIPLIQEESDGKFTYNKVSRTMCPDPDNGDLVISISTQSDNIFDFSLLVNIVHDFEIEELKLYSMTVAPAAPQFFRFTFDENESSTLLHVKSDDHNCMSLSIQNISCPVYDLERTVMYGGLWQTVMQTGGIFLRREEFPLGMFIVFIVHSTNKACTGKTVPVENQEKVFSFQLERSINKWDYIKAVGAVLVAFILIYFTAACFVLFSPRKAQAELCVESPTDPFSYSGLSVSCVPTPTTPMPYTPGFNNDSDLESEVDWVTDATSSVVIRTKEILYVSDLALKDPRILSAKSKLYLWNMSTVAVFYALPVVQLVFTYQQTLMNSGNQDLCYYNFLCSHRLGYISDFNHVFSNIGYLLFGLLFIVLTYRRQSSCQSVGHHLGIPHHFGIFYALGVALCMEGVLSACYHLCPNHSNFQFDTSFMYVLSILTMMKIYQNRHPDITASSYTTFGVLALVIFLCMFGVLNNSSWFYVVFTVIHLLTCFFLTAQIYHVGLWKLDWGMFSRFIMNYVVEYHAGGLLHSLKPLYPARMLLLLLANIGNWGMVAAGFYFKPGDFATYMLGIFLSNLMMYFIFYIVMKLIMKEKILKPAMFYIVLSFVIWLAAFYFFYHKSISWKLTPAQSRYFNQFCKILDFYDYHDIWHFLSAAGMFFSFMVLLTLDDDIAEKDRREIPVF